MNQCNVQFSKQEIAPRQCGDCCLAGIYVSVLICEIEIGNIR